MLTTIGREILRSKLPDKYKHYCDSAIGAKELTALCTEMAADNPDKYIDTLQDLNSFGERVVSTYGRESSLSINDVKQSKAIAKLNQALRDIVKNILNNDKLSDAQKEDKVRDLGYKYTQKVMDAVLDDANKRKTALSLQIKSKSRGNPVQLMQLQVGNMLMKDALGRDIPYLMIDGYAQGASPTAYWTSTSSGRRGFYLTQFATGQAGYLGKQVTNVTHDTNISMEDCGTTDTGVPFAANNVKNVGAVLLRPFHNHPAGSIVTKEMVDEADDKEMMLLRSPMTCKAPHGVCAKCNGLGENGKFPTLGEYVSLNAARSFVEKITQNGISSKHGAARTGKTDTSKQLGGDGAGQPEGFKSVDRMFNAPKDFPGGALLAPEDGIVSDVIKASQGGHYITIGGKPYYTPELRRVLVKPGDKVTAGDIMTDGVPNPEEVMSLKGVGPGRVYFCNKVTEMLKNAGWGVDRRNIESFSRAMINKVRVTNPKGYGSWLPGAIVDYSDVAAGWEPDEDAVPLKASKALNKYLQKPVLYYGVGTRVTPEVADTLSKYEMDDVLVSDKKPPFEPVFLKAQSALQHDKHWLPRLAGERLQPALFDAARQGITDEYDSQSYVDRVVNSPYKESV